jgi:hypothetical protein
MSLIFAQIFLCIAFSLLANLTNAFDGRKDVFLTIIAVATTGWKTFAIITAEDALGRGLCGARINKEETLITGTVLTLADMIATRSEYLSITRRAPSQPSAEST